MPRCLVADEQILPVYFVLPAQLLDPQVESHPEISQRVAFLVSAALYEMCRVEIGRSALLRRSKQQVGKFLVPDAPTSWSWRTSVKLHFLSRIKIDIKHREFWVENYFYLNNISTQNPFSVWIIVRKQMFRLNRYSDANPNYYI